jgi:hypothetical protein
MSNIEQDQAIVPAETGEPINPRDFFDGLNPRDWHKLLSEKKLKEHYRSVGLNGTQTERLITERRNRMEALRQAYQAANEITLWHRNWIAPTTLVGNSNSGGFYTHSNVDLLDVLSVTPHSDALVELVGVLSDKDRDAKEEIIFAGNSEGFQMIANATGKTVNTVTREECPSHYPERTFHPQA